MLNALMATYINIITVAYHNRTYSEPFQTPILKRIPNGDGPLLSDLGQQCLESWFIQREKCGAFDVIIIGQRSAFDRLLGYVLPIYLLGGCRKPTQKHGYCQNKM